MTAPLNLTLDSECGKLGSSSSEPTAEAFCTDTSRYLTCLKQFAQHYQNITCQSQRRLRKTTPYCTLVSDCHIAVDYTAIAETTRWQRLQFRYR
jgi:hypothetical protein